MFGGNTHNDTATSKGAKCYSHDLMAYDPVCDQWKFITAPIEVSAHGDRYGHSASVFNGSM